jgi:hypothetical protein
VPKVAVPILETAGLELIFVVLEIVLELAMQRVNVTQDGALSGPYRKRVH